MQYYSEEEAKPLREAFERYVFQWPQVTMRRMFGCPAYVADSRLFAFLVTGAVVITQVRLKDRQALSEDNETVPFKAGEREIERWIQVTIDDPKALGRIISYVRKSYQTALDAD